jgi:hypothetical protein
MKPGLQLAHLLLVASDTNAFDLDQLSAQLANPAVARGPLIQEKHLRALPQPLTSRGQFVLSRDLGLLWQLQSPLQQDYRIDNQGIAKHSPTAGNSSRARMQFPEKPHNKEQLMNAKSWILAAACISLYQPVPSCKPSPRHYPLPALRRRGAGSSECWPARRQREVLPSGQQAGR